MAQKAAPKAPTSQSGVDVVLDYVQAHNAPLNAQMVADKYKGSVTKAQAEKHLASLAALAKALARGMPDGAAPAASVLAGYKFKYTTAAGGKGKFKATDEAALATAGEAAGVWTGREAVDALALARAALGESSLGLVG